MGQGGTLFHKGVTSRVPQVPRNLSFHPRGEHVFPQGQGASEKNQNLFMGTDFVNSILQKAFIFKKVGSGG
jgi:hypothetical protein